MQKNLNTISTDGGGVVVQLSSSKGFVEGGIMLKLAPAPVVMPN